MSLFNTAHHREIIWRSQRPSLSVEARGGRHVGDADEGKASLDSPQTRFLLYETAPRAASPPSVVADVDDVGVGRVPLCRMDAVGAFIADLGDQGA